MRIEPQFAETRHVLENEFFEAGLFRIKAGDLPVAPEDIFKALPLNELIRIEAFDALQRIAIDENTVIGRFQSLAGADAMMFLDEWQSAALATSFTRRVFEDRIFASLSIRSFGSCSMRVSFRLLEL